MLALDDPDPNDEPDTLDGWKRKTAPPIVIDRYHFKQDGQGYLRPLHTHLSTFDLIARKAEPLTSGSFSEEAPAWSPDGKTIAFVSNRAADPDRTEDSHVFVVDAKPGATPRQLTTFAGPNGGRPSWSPDGRSIAYVQGDETKMSAYQLNQLALVPAAGGSARVLTAGLDRAVSGSITWPADGSSLSVVVEDDRTTYIGRVAATGGMVEHVTTGKRTVSSISPRAAGGFALLAGTAAEEFASKSKDGTEVHGLMFKPGSVAAGRRAPTLLNIHGGPNAQDQHSFSFERQWLAANGYVVLAVNYQHVVQYDTELGPPWRSQDLWVKLSYPFFHADRIKTPTLYLSGLRDFNVPTAGVEQMYQALRSLGVDTELVLYPGQSHGITMPSYARDRLSRYVAWYKKYLHQPNDAACVIAGSTAVNRPSSMSNA